MAQHINTNQLHPAMVNQIPMLQAAGLNLTVSTPAIRMRPALLLRSSAVPISAACRVLVLPQLLFSHCVQLVTDHQCMTVQMLLFPSFQALGHRVCVKFCDILESDCLSVLPPDQQVCRASLFQSESLISSFLQTGSDYQMT